MCFLMLILQIDASMIMLNRTIKESHEPILGGISQKMCCVIVDVIGCSGIIPLFVFSWCTSTGYLLS